MNNSFATWVGIEYPSQYATQSHYDAYNVHYGNNVTSMHSSVMLAIVLRIIMPITFLF